MKQAEEEANPIEPPEATAHNPCGIVMPISAMDEYSAAHWSDVKSIIEAAIKDAAFEPLLVSSADEVSVIHKRIVSNLYYNKMVVCDVSGKNPNVMFELGIRLTFDKPVIIIKDDFTDYAFDTSPIEHMTYRRDLRYADTLRFKADLTEKIKATSHAAEANPNYSPFLRHFGDFQLSKLTTEEVGLENLIRHELYSLNGKLDSVTEILARMSAFWIRRPSNAGSTLADEALWALQHPSESDKEALRAMRAGSREKDVAEKDVDKVVRNALFPNMRDEKPS